MPRPLPVLASLALLGACGGEKPHSRGRCVHNLAYQEHFAPDALRPTLSEAADCYVLLDPDESGAAEAIAALHDRGNVVGCYTSVGTCEDWRDDWEATAPSCVETPWGDWPGEHFVDSPDAALVAAMEDRLARFATLGCDLVEFDNMDWAHDPENVRDYGISASESEAEAYVGALCETTRALGMDCMAKNSTDGLTGPAGGTFESFADEQDWWTHGHLAGVLEDGGIGLVVHYGEPDAEACDAVFETYLDRYGPRLSFLCEHRAARGYRHYND